MLEMSTDLPIIEIVDEEPQIKRLLPEPEKTRTGGLITMQNVVILAYRNPVAEAPPPTAISPGAMT